MAETLGVKI